MTLISSMFSTQATNSIFVAQQKKFSHQQLREAIRSAVRVIDTHCSDVLLLFPYEICTIGERG